jgi:hypothetical protein
VPAADDVAAQDAAEHLARYHYGVLPATTAPDYALLEAGGYNAVLLDGSDPNVGAAVEAARAAGIESVGIWAPSNGEDPLTYAHRLAGLGRYEPDLVVADVGGTASGGAGSPGWRWNEEFASAFRRLAPGQRWAVSMKAGQGDFDYAAYSSHEAQIWPQTFGATYDVTYDPQSVVADVARDGVDPRLINPVLAPSQSGEGLRNYASFPLSSRAGGDPLDP